MSLRDGILLLVFCLGAQYQILRQKGTEPAGSGTYNKHKEEGTYKCAGCGTPLYTSETKFDSGCGWCAFLPWCRAQGVHLSRLSNGSPGTCLRSIVTA